MEKINSYVQDIGGYNNDMEIEMENSAISNNNMNNKA